MQNTTFDRARATLEALGVAVRVARRGADEEVWVLGGEPGGTRVQVLPLSTDEAPRGAETLPRILVAEHVTSGVAERLIRAGDGFADAAGNVHVTLPGIVLHVLGKRPGRPRLPVAPAGAAPRVWRRAAVRALFHLLVDPKFVELPVRRIAEAAGTAPGTIVHLMNDLEGMGHLVRLGRTERRFVPDRALVDVWLREYEQKLRPALALGRFAPVDPEAFREFEPRRHGAWWGGERAAALLGADLRPEVTTLYVERPIERTLHAARLRPDRDGTVDLRHAFWGEFVPSAPREDATHPLLVVGDLMATGDGRCLSAAEEVRERWLARPVG